MDIVSEEKTESKHTQRIIPEGWEVKRIGDIGKVITGKTPSTKEKKYWGHGYPFVTPSDIADFDTRYNYGAEREVTEEWLKVAKNSLLPKDAVCFVCIGSTIGKMCLLKEPSFTNQQINSVVVNENSDSMFTYYLFRKKQKDIRSTYGGGGAAKDIVSKSTFEKIDLILPVRKEEQASIAKILSDLDSKIETNHHMNKTLEAIGQAVFKRWFVDFEFPNEEGKPYKSNGGSLIDSDVGEIPEGWATGGLGSICDITMGQSPPGETYNVAENGLPFFQGIRDFGFRFPSKRVYCTASTRFAEEGDVLLSVRAPIGSLNVAEERCAIGRGIAALRLKGKQNGYLYYLLLATRSAWNEYEAKGTVFGSATKQDVHDFKVIIPPKDLRNQFGSMIEPSDKRILLNQKEIRVLSAIRDSLLPKLMSGQVRVPVSKEIMGGS